MAKTIAGSPASDAEIVALEASVPSILTGSQDAEDALHAVVEPLVGAGDPAALTTAQLNQKWSGIAPAGWTDSVYPTPQ